MRTWILADGWSWLALGAGLVLALAACSDEPPGAPAELQARLPEARQQQLEELGYIEVSEDAVDPSRTGVVKLDPERAQPGYNLYCNHNEGRAELIDLEGRTVHAWSAPSQWGWSSCKLLNNGDLLVAGTERDPLNPGRKLDAQRYLELRAWTGDLRWRRRIPAHHHAALSPDGRIVTLTLGYRRIPEVDPAVDVRDDFVVLLSRDGEVLERRSLYEAFTSNPDAFRMQPFKVLDKWGHEQLDLFHANSVEFMDDPGLADRHAIYAPGNVLVTSRHQDAIAVIEWRTNHLLWAWGQGEILRPHDATVLESGNILLFDNGDPSRPWSRVMELDPLSGKIAWSYRAPDPEEFYTAARGSCQRLPNGNTLITNSNHGQAFEVTPAGEIVWEFLNPHLTPDSRRPAMRRVERYPTEFVEAILEHRAERPS